MPFLQSNQCLWAKFHRPTTGTRTLGVAMDFSAENSAKRVQVASGLELGDVAIRLISSQSWRINERQRDRERIVISRALTVALDSRRPIFETIVLHDQTPPAEGQRKPSVAASNTETHLSSADSDGERTIRRLFLFL